MTSSYAYKNMHTYSNVTDLQNMNCVLGRNDFRSIKPSNWRRKILVNAWEKTIYLFEYFTVIYVYALQEILSKEAQKLEINIFVDYIPKQIKNFVFLTGILQLHKLWYFLYVNSVLINYRSNYTQMPLAYFWFFE